MKKVNLTIEEVTAGLDCIIDENNEMVKIAGCKYFPSEVLQNIDPIAYLEELLNYYNGIRDNYYCEELEK
jgi:hypothetical protein